MERAGEGDKPENQETLGFEKLVLDEARTKRRPNHRHKNGNNTRHGTADRISGPNDVGLRTAIWGLPNGLSSCQAVPMHPLGSTISARSQRNSSVPSAAVPDAARYQPSLGSASPLQTSDPLRYQPGYGFTSSSYTPAQNIHTSTSHVNSIVPHSVPYQGGTKFTPINQTASLSVLTCCGLLFPLPLTTTSGTLR